MTPTELETYVRQRYNAVGDTFFPQVEIFNFFFKAMTELAAEFHCIRRTYTTSSVNGQRAYDWPTNAIAITRMTYDGETIDPNDFMLDDSYTGRNEDDAITGRPAFYQQWGQSFYLRPVPNEDGVTIKLYTYDMPAVPTATSTLDVPTVYHIYLADYALHAMCAQDRNESLADRFLSYWQDGKRQIQKLERMRLSADRLFVVKDMADLSLDMRLPRP